MGRDGSASVGPRGHLRRLAEVRGLVGGHRAPVEAVDLRADDGVPLRAWLVGRTSVEPRTAVVLVHGFAAHGRKPAYARLADGLAARHRVLSIDLRGHGRSGGRSTFGAAEARDVAAGIAWLREHGHDRVVVVGVSMGGTALFHALVRRDVDVDAAVAVSTPAWVGRTDAAPLALLDDVWRTRWKRWGLAAVAGVRIVAPDELDGLDHPAVLAAQVRVPLLVVHGEDDHYFPLRDADELAAAAAGPVTVWREPRFGHAEDGLSRRFARRLGRAIEAAVRTGRFPARRPEP